jgi:hypothetical protein
MERTSVEDKITHVAATEDTVRPLSFMRDGNFTFRSPSKCLRIINSQITPEYKERLVSHTLVSSIGGGRHFEDDVLQGRGL